jgi:hypothetical protein
VLAAGSQDPFERPDFSLKLLKEKQRRYVTEIS